MVRHEDAGAIPTSSAGGVKDALDYIGREGRWEEKSDIEREMTRDDLRLLERHDTDYGVERALDYIGREGDFAEKGRERQFDATYWGQDGPLDRAEVARKMTEAGCYMQSIVTVDRRYAERLELDSKEAFERLVRRTWTQQAQEWTKRDAPTERMFQHADKIDWVASYHTDANASLHVHVYTWGQAGDMEPGDRVSQTSTRKGKELIYRQGYARIWAERNEYHTYLRNISRLNMQRQLGMEIDPKAVEREHLKAERNGWRERVAQKVDFDIKKHPEVERLQFKLRTELEQGHGRLSKNYSAGAVTRDLIRAVEKASPSADEIKRSLDRAAEVKADIYGYTSETYRDRDVMLKRDREDYLSRLVPAVEKACLQTHRPEQLRLEQAAPRLAQKVEPVQIKREQTPRQAQKVEFKVPDWVKERSQSASQPEQGQRSSRIEGDAATKHGMTRKQAQQFSREFYGIARQMRDMGVKDYDSAPKQVRQRVDRYAKAYSSAKGYKCSEKWKRTVFDRAQMLSKDLREPVKVPPEQKQRLAREFVAVSRTIKSTGADSWERAPESVRKAVFDYAQHSSDAHGYACTEKWTRDVFDRAKDFSGRLNDAPDMGAERHQQSQRVMANLAFSQLSSIAQAVSAATASTGGRSARPAISRHRSHGYEQEQKLRLAQG